MLNAQSVIFDNNYELQDDVDLPPEENSGQEPEPRSGKVGFIR